MPNLEGKTVIVTGASRGLGETTARHLAASGANVVLAARSSGEIESIASDIRSSGGRALACPCDVADYADVTRLVQGAEEAFGAVDVLINNAGVIEPIGFLEDTDPTEWGKAFDINVKGVYHGMRAVMPAMVARGSGTIITIGSGAAHHPLDGWSAYCATKAAALMLTTAAHQESGGKGLVHINLSPGIIATDMQRRIRESGINPVSQMDPDSLGDPSIPARILVYLCGPAGSEYAGQDLRAGDPELRKAAGIS
jgi:3-oxoacyl-[acyl-carrier protein] reductase